MSARFDEGRDGADTSRLCGIEDVRAALQKLIDLGAKLEAARLLRRFGATKASEVAAEKRAAFVAAAQAEIELLGSIKFLEALGAPWVLTAIVPDGGTKTVVARTPSEALGFVRAHHGKRNLYFTANRTRTTVLSKPQKTDIGSVLFVHADLDPRDGESPAEAKARYLAALEKSGLPRPTFIIDSGNGLQLLWRLEKSVILGEPVETDGKNGEPQLVVSQEDQTKIDDIEARNKHVLVASGTPAVIPAHNATTKIPIVFIAALDPVATGVVTSLARPGGNVTGLTAVFSDLTGKRLELLKELLPSLSRVALLSRPANPGHFQYVEQALAAARILRIELEVMAVNSPDDFEAAFRRVQGVDALIQIDDAMFTSHRETLVELATRYRIPGAYGFREFVEIGGFVAVGPSYSDLYRRAGSYLDKILKGVKPADLPVEQASKFEFIVNLETAQALGLEVPPTLLARADEVIE